MAQAENLSKEEIVRIIDEMIEVGVHGCNGLILSPSFYNAIKDEIVDGYYKGKEVFTSHLVKKNTACLAQGSMVERINKSIHTFLN